MHSGTRAQPEQNGARAIRSASVNHIPSVGFILQAGEAGSTLKAKHLKLILNKFMKIFYVIRFFILLLNKT